MSLSNNHISSINSKPILITKEDLLNLGNDIKLVSVNPSQMMAKDSEIPFSVRMINWVEPFTIAGHIKTCFYTEVNSNIKVGDRVFIINGNYDSDLLIKNNKYKKGRDGYKVLFIDRCKIVLDIDFSNIKPWEEESNDNYIRVYYVNDEREFIFFNKELTTFNQLNSHVYKFSKGNNNLVYTDKSHTGNYGWASEIKKTAPHTNGFYLIDTDTNLWTSVNANINTGGFPTGTFSSVDYHNSRLKIIGGTFTYNGVIFRDGFVYKFENNKWVVDVTHFQPIISKSNFRDGLFKGEWNNGLYGQQSKRIDWGQEAIWNTGTVLNTNWVKGRIDSKHFFSNSYFTELDTNGLPFQKIDTQNNKGFGYNYFIDSKFNEFTITNGNGIRSNYGNSIVDSNIEKYLLNNNQSHDLIVRRGSFNSCDLNDTYLYNSLLSNSRVSNCVVEKTRSINSHFKDALFKNSNINSDDIIKVLDYDEIEVNFKNSEYIMFKFFIDEVSYKRLKNKDYFYIKGVGIKGNNDILNFFDRKFKIDNYNDYQEDFVIINNNNINNTTFKKQREFVVSLSLVIDNENPLYSIDIVTLNPDVNKNEIIGKDNIDISNAYIIDAEFNSGLFDNSNWNSGNYINFNNDVNISSTASMYNISVIGDNKIRVEIPRNFEITDNDYFAVGKIVFINSVDNIDNNVISRIGDTYKVLSSTILSNKIILDLSEIGTNTIQSGMVGQFLTIDGFNRYGYLHKVKIHKSKIKSGIFRRCYLSNSLVENKFFNNRDFDLVNKNNLKTLLLSDIVISNNKNIIKSGLFINSTFVGGDDIWLDGISHESIWNGLTFSNGIIRNSSWINGVFNNGWFYESRSFTDNNPINYNNNTLSSYYKSGVLPNNRHSWQNGVFNNGQFNKSAWENGVFNKGKFYMSDFYKGQINDGIFGNSGVPVMKTRIYSAEINKCVVNNSALIAENIDTNNTSYINWYNGVFNTGIFGSSQSSTTMSQALWHDGTFNGGEFRHHAKWINGTFNGGKFISNFGVDDYLSSIASHYTWENGIFNGGEFGTGEVGATNSTWYNGEFNGGVFKGKVWNNGIFSYGEFIGSGSQSSVGGLECENAKLFVAPFINNNFYGLWRNGIITDIKDKFILDKKIFTKTVRKGTNINVVRKAKIVNSLWENGTFTHPSGEMINCVWLNGKFENGVFKDSSFNPHVLRNNTISFEKTDSCYWKNGVFDNSEIHISTWEDGKFLYGTAVGIIWKKGVSNYMNAYNIFWEDGLWRNGNWHGSPYVLSENGLITSSYEKDIINNGISWSGTSSCHVWNIFSEEEFKSKKIASGLASTVSGYKFLANRFR
jgi:hypothetical protein